MQLRSLALVATLVSLASFAGTALAQSKFELKEIPNTSVVVKPLSQPETRRYFGVDAKSGDYKPPFKVLTPAFSYHMLGRDLADPDEVIPRTLQAYEMNVAFSDKLVKEHLPVGYAVPKSVLAVLLNKQANGEPGILSLTKTNVLYMCSVDDSERPEPQQAMWTVFIHWDPEEKQLVVRGEKEPRGYLEQDVRIYGVTWKRR